jgi:hypothetical protein
MVEINTSMKPIHCWTRIYSFRLIGPDRHARQLKLRRLPRQRSREHGRTVNQHVHPETNIGSLFSTRTMTRSVLFFSMIESSLGPARLAKLARWVTPIQNWPVLLQVPPHPPKKPPCPNCGKVYLRPDLVTAPVRFLSHPRPPCPRQRLIQGACTVGPRKAACQGSPRAGSRVGHTIEAWDCM